MRRTAPVLVLAAALAASPAAAQQVPLRPTVPPAPAPAPAPTMPPAPPAWLGVGYDLRLVQLDGRCSSQLLVETVVQGSPAERAGLRTGDVILAIDGDTAPAARLATLAGHLAPGDSVRLRTARGAATRDVIAVADRRPERPSTPVLALPRPAGTPGLAIRVAGDSLIATGLLTAAAGPPGATGFWLTEADGRTAYRVLAGEPRTELGRRVADLLDCARVPRPAPTPAGMREVQARADSLRMVIARRALESGEEQRVVLRAAPQPVPAPVASGRPTVFHVETPAASLHGVAGAEVTALEPELAAYFRPARSGLLVLRVAPGTAAERGGLRPGDVIVAAAGDAVASPLDLRTALTAGGGDTVELTIVRQGRRRALTIPRP